MTRGIGQPFVYDELVTVRNFVEAPSLLDPLRRQVIWNNHPFFSLLERIVYAVTGSSSPATLRVLPILIAAAAVALLAYLAARRFGIVPGAVAAVVLAANPMFFANARMVRGYGLLVLCAIASTALLGRLLDGRPSGAARFSYVLCVGVALGTHLYAVFVVAGHVAYVMARRRVSTEWAARWASAAVVGSVAYIGMLSQLPIGDRPRQFKASLPWDVAISLLGGHMWIALPIAVLLFVGARRGGIDRATTIAVGALMAGFVAVWLLVANFDTYPRFFVWAVPGIAWAMAASTSARQPAKPMLPTSQSDARVTS